MPKPQNLSALLKEKLQEHELLAAEDEKYEALVEICKIIISRFDELSVNDLMFSTNEIPSIFWIICNKEGYFKGLFLKVWERFGEEIPIEALLAKAQKGRSKGISSVFILSDIPEAFLAVWQRFRQQIPIEALLATAQEGPYKGNSALWFLSLAAANNKPEAIDAVLQRFLPQIPLEAFLAESQSEGEEGQFALLLLAHADGVSDRFWNALLQHNPGLITDAKLNFVSLEMSKYCLKDKFEALKLMPLVNARNRFFSLLKSESLSSEAQTKALFEEAKKATDVGYINAFYDLGHFLRAHSQHAIALEALKLVPNTSCHYDQVIIELCEAQFAFALAHFDNPAKRMHHLQDSLQYALQTDDDKRAMLIQRIASIYIEGKKEIGDSHLVPQEWLEAMNSSTSVEWCINRFMDIKKQKDLEKELREKNETLAVERSAMKHVLARMEALESENQTLKKQRTEVAPINQTPVRELEEANKPMLLFRNHC